MKYLSPVLAIFDKWKSFAYTSNAILECCPNGNILYSLESITVSIDSINLLWNSLDTLGKSIEILRISQGYSFQLLVWMDKTID